MFKRLICIFLIVITLCLSVNDTISMIDDTYCAKVEAVELVAPALGFATMYALCYYFGTVSMTLNPASKLNTISDDAIAKVGHKMIQNLNCLNEQRQAAISMLDGNGQSYVFGNESLKVVSDTSFTVIQGGKNDNNDDDDDGNNNIINFPKNHNFKNLAIALAGSVAASVLIVAKDNINKLFNKEENIYSEVCPYIDNLDRNFTFEDQTGMYTPQMFVKTRFGSRTYYHYLNQNITYNGTSYTSFSNGQLKSYNGAQWKTFGYKAYNGTQILFKAYNVENGNVGSVTYDYCVQLEINANGGLNGGHSNAYIFWGEKILSFSANFPIFETEAEGLAWAQNYQIADWLQDDWTGELIDPLTGYNRASDLFPAIAHDGLNAIGNLDPDAFKDWLRDWFENARGRVPVPNYDPTLDPVKYPDTTPDVQIQVGEDDFKQPSWRPTPGPDPDPTPDPTPETDLVPDPSEILPDLDLTLPDLGDILKTKFPFCIPWDLYSVILSLKAPSLIPHYEIPVHYDNLLGLEINETLVIDLAIFNRMSKFIRGLISILYIVGLMIFSVRAFGKDM